MWRQVGVVLLGIGVILQVFFQVLFYLCEVCVELFVLSMNIVVDYELFGRLDVIDVCLFFSEDLIVQWILLWSCFFGVGECQQIGLVVWF